ncbi:2OG-Fe(II) oxygenase [Actinophytocola oryzae]|uniref:Uncharacterized protein n=1 Tax=Actinophytocola oryzae TaxID=502181 RepID=A0A4R7W156_9PSEU|nr:2OG-Fe(II) oxygenase [Actinophytocola oryzae]TDV56263.1 hypothetical protein CLV71_102329 [Actinophytocola oryzae]
MSINSRLATVNVLDQKVLGALFDGDVIAILVPKFYDSLYCKNLAASLYQSIDNESVSGGIYDSDIDSYWNVMNDEQRRERYFSMALSSQDRLRRLSTPYPSPIDLLRLALDEAWAGGATLMTMAGRKMPFGITRLWRTGSEGLPHQDALWREVGRIDEVAGLTGQLGVNVYLDTADEGGELETWDRVITDEEYASLAGEYPGSYGYPREMLPEESLLVTPRVGDLVLINTMRVHAIRAITRGQRMTISGFVGSSGTGAPLKCWS